MRQYRGINILLWIVAIFIAANVVFAQEKKTPLDSETRSEVPELAKFHGVIYKIWHTAWPKKNVTMLKELLPEVEQRGNELANAQLPGILREKKIAWTENIAKMKSAIDAYRTAVAETNSQSLLDAAEQLHAQYETLVRVVRPALKELDDFHAALYPLYHYYTPEKNFEAMKASVLLMKERMSALEKAKLPARFKEKEESFGRATAKLAEALNAMEVSLSSKDQADIQRNVNALHSRYEELSKLIE